MNPLKAFVKSHTSQALRRSVRDVLLEAKLSLRHSRGIRKVAGFLGMQSLRLNLGCGPNKKPGWLNVDFFDASADVQLDLREPWPFADNSVDYIYSEHVFEHFEFYKEVPHFLAESLRILRPGGVFDVGVPDTEWPLCGYGNPQHDYWPFAPTHHPASCETQLDHINFHFRQGTEHKYAWDEETLRRSLVRAGFTSVVRREFDTALDAEFRKIGTLYMRATKP